MARPASVRTSCATPSSGGLNAALLAGAAALRAARPDLALARWPRTCRRCARWSSASRSTAAATVARSSPTPQGTGTTLLTATAGCCHPIRGSGPVPERRTRRPARSSSPTRDWCRLRCDVDTEVDLWHARIGWVSDPHGCHARASTAVVRDREPAGHRAQLRLSHPLRHRAARRRGRRCRFDAEAFDAGGLRLLRPGQRVRLRTESSATGSRHRRHPRHLRLRGRGLTAAAGGPRRGQQVGGRHDRRPPRS